MNKAFANGGAAFPGAPTENEHGVRFDGWGGMSLRDWFAGQALVGIVYHAQDLFEDATTVADVAYHFADAMIAARDKVQP